MIHDHEVVAKRALKMALEGKVIAIDGTEIELKAETLCVHGDNPAAVQMVKKIREELKAAGVNHPDEMVCLSPCLIVGERTSMFGRGNQIQMSRFKCQMNVK